MVAPQHHPVATDRKDSFKSSGYLSRVHGMQLVSVEVDVEADVFAGLQDGAGGVQVKHALLTEHVDVVDSQRPGGHQRSEPRQLDLQDVLCGFCHGLPSEGHRDTARI